jgi:hypothetical protein
MSADQFAVVLFYSSNYALRGEKVLNQAGIQSKLIPVPRQISSDCGVCLRIVRADQDTARQALADAGVEIDGVHEI